MITLIALSFLVLLALGVPVAFVIGVSGFVGLWWSGQYPLTVLASPFQIPVPDTATFIRLYDTFFTPEARCAIVQSSIARAGSADTKDAAQITPDGISIGSGLLWAARSGTTMHCRC